MQISIKYRPRKFAQVCGQEISKRILMNSILMNRVPKAILFSGIRGIGKTTLARLYAQALNCESFTDDVCGKCPSCEDAIRGTHLSILEFDAASHSGVDNVRTFEDIVKQLIPHKYRVFILDEAHMLTKEAQAALLKIMEGPSKNTLFILVTTDVARIKDTVQSRCLQMPLLPLDASDVARNIKTVLEAEQVAYTDDFVNALSCKGDGAVRDIQQMLDALILAANDKPLDVDIIQQSSISVSLGEYKELAAVIDQRNLKFFMSEIERWYREGRDLISLFDKGVPIILRDFAMFLVNSDVTVSDVKYMSQIPHDLFFNNLTMPLEEIKRAVNLWEKLKITMKDSYPRLIWEMFAVGLCVKGPDTTTIFSNY